MSAVTLALLAAFANAGQGILSKNLTLRYPARQLIGPLLLLNCLLLLPLAPFVEWHWTPQIVVLHLVSAFLMVVSSVAVWDLFDAGAASATTTAQALSPLAAAVGAAILIPGTVSAGQVAAAVVVVVGVTWALQGAFQGLGQRGSAARILVTAAAAGLLTVLTRMLADLDVGLVETYVVRTGLAAAVMLMLIPPGDVPRDATPRLLVRAIFVTTYYALTIMAVQRGSPVVVQTLLAVTPLLLLGWETVRARAWPTARAMTGATLVVVGVVIVLAI